MDKRGRGGKHRGRGTPGRGGQRGGRPPRRRARPDPRPGSVAAHPRRALAPPRRPTRPPLTPHALLTDALAPTEHSPRRAGDGPWTPRLRRPARAPVRAGDQPRASRPNGSTVPLADRQPGAGPGPPPWASGRSRPFPPGRTPLGPQARRLGALEDSDRQAHPGPGG